MNKEKYLELRNALLSEIEKHIGNGELEDSEAKMKEVEELDNKWEEIKLANANLNALKDNAKAIDLTNKNIDLKGGTIVEEISDKTIVDESKLYENAWAKSIVGIKLENEELEVFNKVNSEFKNDSPYTHDTQITTLIPKTVVEGIWKRAEEQYPLLGDVRKYNVRGTLKINKHTAITQGDAAFYDEDTATTDEVNTFGELVLSGHELSKVVTVSWKMRSMSVEDFIPFIKRELGDRIGAAMGTAIASGAGLASGEPEGIETALAAEGNTPQIVTYNNDSNKISYDKIVQAIAKIHSSYLNGCAVYANNATIWNKLATLKDDEKRPLFIPDVTAGGVGKMFGMTVKADAGITANYILIGNADRGYVMNTNEPMSLATEEHVKARTVDYAAYAIVDGGVLDTQAFALVKKS
ncbi:MAG: phage major capsid protein [Peptostreptococcales bacterium]